MTYDKSRFLLLLKKASGESKDEVRKRIHENEIAGLKSDISGRSYSLKSNEANFLQRYKQKLVNHENNAQKIKLIEENYGEIENIFNTLKNEVDHAFEESVELEHISQALKDKELVRKTKYDESAVEDLREKLEHMISMKKEMEKRESKLESLSQHFDDIEHAVRLRIELIETVIDESDTGGGTGGASVGPYDCYNCGEDNVLLDKWNDEGKTMAEWRCPNCNARLDWGDLDWSGYSLVGSNKTWQQYGPKVKDGQVPPWQGWKLHISCRPSEAKKFIQNMKGKLTKDQHKFASHPSHMVAWEQNKSGTQFKVMTLYASIDSGKEDKITQKEGGQLATRVVKNPANSKQQALNYAFVNSNKERTEKIIEYTLKDSLNDTIGFNGGEEISSPGYERRVGKSRVHYRYDNIGAYNLDTSQGYCIIGNNYDASSNRVSTDSILEYHNGDQHVLNGNGDVVGFYKGKSGHDAPDVSKIGAENLNPSV